MTTRDTTPLLARSGGMEVERDARDWAYMLGFGAIGWPWLLKSLYGGRQKDKADMLKRLGLCADALPNLGSWKADVGLLNLIIDLILSHKPQVVVELGAGASTLIAARALQMAGTGGRLVSFDQHDDFVLATRQWLNTNGLHADIRHAPLTTKTGQWADLWYDLDGVPDQIDLLLIDGPPWAVNPMIRGRAEQLFSAVSRGGVVVLDDAARPGERIVAHQWKRDWPAFDWRFISGIKGTLVGVKI
ncbi:MAG: class I SAM-dependent methyltransferase [Chakrabartia sp.]